MRTATALFILAVLALALLLGCTTNEQAATFDTYEYAGDASLADILQGEYDGPADLPKKETTGMALVTLRDGSKIKASCAFQGLKRGQEVRVRLNDDGSWAVVSVD